MKKKLANILKYVLLLAILIIFIFVVHKFLFNGHKFTMRRLRRYILSYGKFSAFCFVIIYSIKPIVMFIPASFLSVLAGNIFGPLRAFILSMIGCFFSGTVAFYLSRYLGKPFVNKILKGKVLKLDDDIEKHGFAIMFLMRLAFVFPYDPLSYAAGITKVKYKDFITGTMLGIIPEMFMYSFIGKNIRRIYSAKVIIPILLVAFLAFFASYVYKKYKKEI